jgi:hypothetical protein
MLRRGWVMSKAGSSTADRPSLDYTAENPTRGEGGFSGSDTDDEDPEKSENSQNWNQQQSRVFQRSVTMLKYWEARNYGVLWLTFTSSPESLPADDLAYSHQRLRQRVERADLAMCDGEHCPHHEEPTGHRLTHIDQLEHLQIRTCEGPQGVIHAFWAWDRDRLRDGNHGKELYIPQNWLSDQWAALHGSEVPTEPDELEVWPESAAGHMERLARDRAPYIVDVRRVGDEHTEGDHKPEHMAAYAASQYLGAHGEALEHLGWSHGRSLGGPLAETWEHLVKIAESLDDAIEKWDRVIAGSEVEVETGNKDRGCHSLTVFKPPPSLGVEVVSASVTPPPDYFPEGPDASVRTESFASGASGEGMTPCTECRRFYEVSAVETVKSRRDGPDVRLCRSCRGEPEPEQESDRQVSLDESTSLSADVQERVEELVRVEGVQSVVSVMGRLGIDPSKREAVCEVVESAE